MAKSAVLSGDVITAKEALETWSRLPDETEKAWAAFELYRNMPSGTRSMDSVAKTVGVSGQRIYQFSAQYAWTKRVRDYDRYLDRIKVRELEAEYADMGRRQGQQAAYLAEMLMYPARELVKRMTNDPDKFTKEMETLPIAEALDMAVKAARVWPQIMKAERLAHGLTTENIGGDIEDATEHVIRIDASTDAVTYLRALAEIAGGSGDTSADE